MHIVFFALFLLTAFVTGLLGTTRRLGFWLAFFLSFLITPLGAAILTVLSGRKKLRRNRPIPKAQN